MVDRTLRPQLRFLILFTQICVSGAARPTHCRGLHVLHSYVLSSVLHCEVCRAVYTLKVTVRASVNKRERSVKVVVSVSAASLVRETVYTCNSLVVRRGIKEPLFSQLNAPYFFRFFILQIFYTLLSEQNTCFFANNYNMCNCCAEISPGFLYLMVACHKNTQYREQRKT